MNGLQYEEFCRWYFSRKLGIPREEIRSPRLPAPARAGHTPLAFQIDLEWTTETAVACYQTIVEAKCQGEGALVQRAAVMQLAQVRDAVGAHKAILVTNGGFGQGAKAAARQHGIALLCLEPSRAIEPLHESDRPYICVQLDVQSETRPIVGREQVIAKDLKRAAERLDPTAPPAAPVRPEDSGSEGPPRPPSILCTAIGISRPAVISRPGGPRPPTATKG